MWSNCKTSRRFISKSKKGMVKDCHLRTKNEKSEDYSKADFKQRVLFFVTIFRLAIPAFFRFTDVTGTAQQVFEWGG